MKEFFTWYLVSSIVGLWSIAYAFYRISCLHKECEYSKGAYRTLGNENRALQSDLLRIDKSIGSLEDNQALLHSAVSNEISNRVKSYIDIKHELSERILNLEKEPAND